MSNRVREELICGCVVLVAAIVLVFLIRSTPEPSAAAEVAVKLKPFCHLDSHTETDLRKGAELHVWSFRAWRLKKFDARLQVKSDGSLKVLDDIEYEWEN